MGMGTAGPLNSIAQEKARQLTALQQQAVSRNFEQYNDRSGQEKQSSDGQ